MSVTLLAILPPGPSGSLHDYAPCARAVEEAVYHRENADKSRQECLTDAVVLMDGEVNVRGGAEVFEMLTNGPRVSLVIPCQTPLPYLLMHVKDLGRFCSLEVVVVDSGGGVRRVTASNRQASVRISEEGKALSMPLAMVPGWNHIKLDLVDLCARAFGVEYKGCVEVSVMASCRVARIWFASRQLDDTELPPWLKTL